MLRATNESLKFTHSQHMQSAPCEPLGSQASYGVPQVRNHVPEVKECPDSRALIEALNLGDCLAGPFLASNNGVDCLGFLAVLIFTPPEVNRHCFSF